MSQAREVPGYHLEVPVVPRPHSQIYDGSLRRYPQQFPGSAEITRIMSEENSTNKSVSIYRKEGSGH